MDTSKTSIVNDDVGSVSSYEDSIDDTVYVDLNVEFDDDEIKRRATWKYKIGIILWDSVDKTEVERNFLFKLDFFLLSTAMLGYFIKNLNGSNIGTAYVNGMKEYYGMTGNQYNYMSTSWTVGYIIGQIPSSLVLHKLSPRFYLAGMELVWASLNICLVYQNELYGFYFIRFLIGLTESGYFPAMEYLIGSWYTKKELTKRSTLFACSGSVAGLISGPLQQAILESNWANKTYKPFQWMFIFDTLISVPVAFYTLIFNPNTPSTTKAFYFSETDKKVALERRRRAGAQIKHISESYTWGKIKSFGNTWHIWIFPLLFLSFNNAGTPISQQSFQLWMKNTLKLQPHQYNIYPVAISAAGIVYSLLVAYINDFSQGRLNSIFLVIMFSSVVFSCASLAAWDIPIWLHWFAYFGIGIPLKSGQPLIFSWVNRLLSHDDMKRNFVIVCTNTLAYVTGATIPLITFNHKDQPEFHIGFTYTAFLASVGLILTALTFFLGNRDDRILKKQKNYEVVDEEIPLLN